MKNQNNKKEKRKNAMLNIVIPMAGRGRRYSNVGYDLPKPLINVVGAPMIKRVIDNLAVKQEHRFIFIVSQDHIDEYGIDSLLRKYCKDPIIIPVTKTTEGQASSALLAKDYVNNDEPLMIANCDQYVTADIDDYLAEMSRRDADGLIMTLTADNPEWSFVRLNSENVVTEVVEKQVVSNHATVGIFNFARGKDYVYAAETMIRENFRVNGEFYVAPAYNYIIREGAKVVPYDIGTVGNGMYGMGTPRELEWLLKNCPNVFDEVKSE